MDVSVRFVEKSKSADNIVTRKQADTSQLKIQITAGQSNSTLEGTMQISKLAI